MSLLRRVFAYATNTVLSTVISLLSIPVLISNLGAPVWAQLMVAQTGATVAGMIASWGWGARGAVQIAAMDRSGHYRYLRESLRTRSALLAIALLPMVAVVYLSGTDRVTSVVFAVAWLVPSLGFTWYFVGIGDPRALLKFDLAPRLLGTTVGIGVVVWGLGALAFAVVILVSNIAGFVAQSAVAMRRTRPVATGVGGLRPIREDLRDGLWSTVLNASSMAYVNVPVLVVAALVPNPVNFVLADRVTKFCVAAALPLSQVAQGWVPNPDPDEQARRIRFGFSLMGVLSLVAGVVYGCLLPTASQVISAGVVRIGFPLAMAFGAVLGAVLLSRFVGLTALMALKKDRAVAMSTVAGATVGVPLIWGLTEKNGVGGAAVAMAAAEFLVLAVQLVVLRRSALGLSKSTSLVSAD